MIDLTAPRFEGTDKEKLEQLSTYTEQLHDVLSRKFENIDITDLNYTLAEMIRRKPVTEIAKRGGGDGGETTIINNHYYPIHFNALAADIDRDYDSGAQSFAYFNAICEGDLLIYNGMVAESASIDFLFPYISTPTVYYSVQQIIAPPNFGQQQQSASVLVDCDEESIDITCTTGTLVNFTIIGNRDTSVDFVDYYTRPLPGDDEEEEGEGE